MDQNRKDETDWIKLDSIILNLNGKDSNKLDCGGLRVPSTLQQPEDDHQAKPTPKTDWIQLDSIALNTKGNDSAKLDRHGLTEWMNRKKPSPDGRTTSPTTETRARLDPNT